MCIIKGIIKVRSTLAKASRGNYTEESDAVNAIRHEMIGRETSVREDRQRLLNDRAAVASEVY